ncbi:MAG: type VI secretion system protein TssA [Deltaproteobacteria bacterium]|jgi:type VI secretion system protein VasJ|nr:type VI secretion system protein TssA [Deltaproteobacteria bacterium]
MDQAVTGQSIIDQQIVQLGTEPIPGDNPCGQEIRQEADYLAIQAEIERMSALSGVQTGVNWRLVVELGQKILAQSSKDLTVAVYLALALLETRPLTILATVAVFLSEFLERFWDNFYPPVKRLRARVNSLDWWREKTLVCLKRFDGKLSPTNSNLMVESLKRLDKILAERDLVNLAEIVNLVKNLPLLEEPSPATPANAPDPNQAGSAAKEASAAPTAQAAASPSAAPSQPAAQDPQEALKIFMVALRDYLQTNLPLKDPWRYKLTQIALWLRLTGPPPSTGSFTELPVPPPEMLSSTKALLEKGQAAEALAALEAQVASYPFWLDFHKTRVDCLKALGYETAAVALTAEIQVFLQMWPTLRTLKFEDGTPLISEETGLWLQNSAQSQSDGETDRLVELKTLARGNPGEALVALANPAKRPTDGRGLMTYRIMEARLWLKMGRKDLALGLTQWLLATLSAQSLDTWEPSLAIEALSAIYDIYLALGPDHAQDASAIAQRLALINPDSALGLKIPPETT